MFLSETIIGMQSGWLLDFCSVQKHSGPLKCRTIECVTSAISIIATEAVVIFHSSQEALIY